MRGVWATRSPRNSTKFDHRVDRRIEIQATDIGGLLPEVRVVAGHPRLGLPRLEIQRFAQPPDLRRRDPHTLFVQPAGQRLHGPADGVVGRRFRHRLDHQQHIVMAIDRHPARPVPVGQARQANTP